MRLHSKDNVLVTKGRDRGKQGSISRVLIKQQKVVVEGISNVALICQSCMKPTRVAYRRLADGNKARYCSRCEEIIE